MLKAAIEKIQKMAKPEIRVIEDRTFAISDDEIKEIRPTLDIADCLPLCSLDAMVKMVKTEALVKHDPPLYIMIPDHLHVRCFSQPNSELRCYREIFYEASATDVPGWKERIELPFEEAMIALRTRFEETVDTTYALKLLSEITTGAKVTFNDNGVATTVVTKKGVDLQTNQAIRPIVKLKPYRTFQEISQPESEFLIRINDRGIVFIEADGGMWKLHAREAIKDYLELAFAKEIDRGDIIVAL